MTPEIVIEGQKIAKIAIPQNLDVKSKKKAAILWFPGVLKKNSYIFIKKVRHISGANSGQIRILAILG